MKDNHVVGKKMARKDRKTNIYASYKFDASPSIVSPLIFQSHEGTSLANLDKAPILVVSASNPYEVG